MNNDGPTGILPNGAAPSRHQRLQLPTPEMRSMRTRTTRLADASIVVLATRYGARDLLTLDERHFRGPRGPAGRPFRLLPADA
jgi:hypothetical protein